MKLFKKNQSGMTLLEVVIAMAYFSAATLGVCMSLAAAVKYSARNMRRDSELNNQQTAVEKSTNDGVALNDGVAEGSNTLNFDIKYIKTNETTGASEEKEETVTQGNVTEYKALKSKANVEDFDFQIKSFASTPLGNATLILDDDEDEYMLSFLNKSSSDVSLTLEWVFDASSTATARFFEGSYSEYVHASNKYTCTVSKVGGNVTGLYTEGEKLLPSELQLGLHLEDFIKETTNAAGTTTYDYTVTLKIDVVSDTGATDSYTLTQPDIEKLLNSTDKKLSLTYSDADGLDHDIP